MSWLSGIAGKAEALLDSIDQAAATSIQSTGLATPNSRTLVGRGTHETALTYEPTASVCVEKTLSLPPKPPSSVPLPHKHGSSYSPVAYPEAPPQTTPTPSSYNAFSKSRSSVPNDDSIFEFLNTPTRAESKKPFMPKNLSKRTLAAASPQYTDTSDSPVQSQPPNGVGEKRRHGEEGDEKEGVAVGASRDENRREKRETEKDTLKESQAIDDTDNVSASPITPQSSAALGSGEVAPDPVKSGEQSVDDVRLGEVAGSDLIVRQPTLAGGKGDIENAAPLGSSDLSEQKVVSCHCIVSNHFVN